MEENTDLETFAFQSWGAGVGVAAARGRNCDGISEFARCQFKGT